MEKPLISILMSTRNEKPGYLHDAVRSIKDQTYNNWEFLIYDDASDSTDNYEWLIQEASRDLRICIWRGEHVGLAAALNILLAKAQGDFFARMDSDDKAYPERLHKEMEYLFRYPDTVLVGSWIRIVNHEGEEIHISGRPDYMKKPWSRSAHSTWCGRTAALRAIGGYSANYPVSQDYDCWLRLQSQGRVGVVEEVLLDYRWGRISSTRSLDQIRYFHIANEMQRLTMAGEPTNFHEVEKRYFDDSAWMTKKIKGRAIAQEAMQSWQRGLYRDASKHYLRSLWLYPLSVTTWIFLLWVMFFKKYPSQLIPLLRTRLYMRNLLYVNSHMQERAVCLCKREKEEPYEKLTIIVPTCNRDGVLARLLETLVEQRDYIDNVIIVDAGSKSVEYVVDRYPVLMITYVRSSQASLTLQRNLGIQNLTRTARLVCFFDDDIILKDNALKNMVAYWNSVGSEVGGVAFNIVSEMQRKPSVLKKLFLTTADERGKVLRSGFASMLSPVDQDYFTDWIFGGATVWRRDILEAYQFDEWFKGYGYAEDLCFSYEVGKKYKLAVIRDAKVLHEKDSNETINNFKFGVMQVVNRGYFVRKFKEFSFWFFAWALLGQWAENVYMSLRRHDISYVLRALGNMIGVLVFPFIVKRKVFRVQAEE